jgi:hypothetical protein
LLIHPKCLGMNNQKYITCLRGMYCMPKAYIQNNVIEKKIKNTNRLANEQRYIIQCISMDRSLFASYDFIFNLCAGDWNFSTCRFDWHTFTIRTIYLFVIQIAQKNINLSIQNNNDFTDFWSLTKLIPKKKKNTSYIVCAYPVWLRELLNHKEDLPTTARSCDESP